MKRIPRDLFDFEDLNPDIYWKEPSDIAQNVEATSDIGDNCSRKGVDVRTIDINHILYGGQNVEDPANDSDYDDTYWDWMHAKDATFPGS